MTATLLIPLVGPLQAWGVDARFDLRQSGSEPSKSGVIGLCCAALGRDRSEPIDDLAALVFGVRVDQEGRLSRDFHTALNVIGASDSKLRTVVSNRWYLANAAFLAGLEGPEDLLHSIHAALQRPHWALVLGRKSCPPSVPPGSGAVVRQPLSEALLAHEPLDPGVSQFRLVLEDPLGSQSRPDQPLGPFAERRFGLRRVTTLSVPRFAENKANPDLTTISSDQDE
jgi:CRISPR system Cascade subunit CasD